MSLDSIIKPPEKKVDPTLPKRPATIYFERSGEETIIRGGDMDGNIEDEVMYWLGKSPGIYINDYDRIYAVEHIHKVDLTHCIQRFHDRQIESEEATRQVERRRQYEELKKEFEP